MKTYTLCLPVYKQGDDFASHIEANNGHPAQSFIDLSDQYKSAAEICQAIASNISISDNLDAIEVNGDTHTIWVTVPDEFAPQLVRDGILIEVECNFDEE